MFKTILSAIKLWWHCLLTFHRMGFHNEGKRQYHFCWDCDFQNNDSTRIVKKIWDDDYDRRINAK